MRPWVHSPSYKAAIAELVAARQASGLTQRAVAERLGKPASYVAKIEVGERRLDFVEFIAFARAIGANEVELMRTVAAAIPGKVEI